MFTSAARRLQPALGRLEAFSSAMRQVCALTVAASIALAPLAPANASDVTPENTVAFDFTKIGEVEIIPGTGIKLSDLGEFAPQALDLLARGFPPIGILKDIFKTGMEIKGKIEAKAQRAEDVARMKSIDALLLKVSAAMAEETLRSEARFQALAADNRKTHEALSEANRRLAFMETLLEKAAAGSDAIAKALKELRANNELKTSRAGSRAATPPPRRPNETKPFNPFFTEAADGSRWNEAP